MDPQAFLELPCPVRRRIRAERVLVRLEEYFGSQLVEYERNMVRARHGEEQSAGLWRIEMANVHAHAAAEQEAEVVRCRFLAAAALDNASAHPENRCERLEEGFVRERDRAAVAELVLADRGAQLREEAHRELISIEVLNDCWIQCGFLRVSMKSLLWLRLRREIVAEKAKEECETVFCATGIKVPMVQYLNESCKSLSDMSSGPHGQTSDPSHEFSSAYMCNEVFHKSCSLHKSICRTITRDNCVCFGSHLGIPPDPDLCNVIRPEKSSQFRSRDSWYTFHLTYLWVAPVEAICFGMPEPVGNNMPKSTTVCLDYFNEIVPCISTCPSGQHLASHEFVCDLLLRKCVVRQRCFEIKRASVSHAAYAKMQSLFQEWTENSECDIKYIEGYTNASNTLECKAVDVKTAVGIWTGNVSCISKLCGVPPSIANTFHISVERYYLDFVAYNCNSGYSLNGLRYSRKEFFLRCKSDETYDVPHLTCQPINCILEDALTVKRIDLSDGSLASSSPVVLDPNEWLKYRCGEGRTLSGISDSSNLFTMTCLDGDHTMTHCKSVQCGVPPVIAHAMPLGSCFVTITYGEQVEYQCEADYHVESELKSGSKPEGRHAKERAEPEQPVQTSEEPVGAVSSCGHLDSWIGQEDRPFPSHEWLEDRSCARCEEMSQWAVLVMGPPGTGKTDAVRLLVSRVRRTYLECDIRTMKGRKLVVLILKGQGVFARHRLPSRTSTRM